MPSEKSCMPRLFITIHGHFRLLWGGPLTCVLCFVPHTHIHQANPVDPRRPSSIICCFPRHTYTTDTHTRARICSPVRSRVPEDKWRTLYCLWLLCSDARMVGECISPPAKLVNTKKTPTLYQTPPPPATMYQPPPPPKRTKTPPAFFGGFLVHFGVFFGTFRVFFGTFGGGLRYN